MKIMKTIIIILFTSTFCFSQTVNNIDSLAIYSGSSSVTVLGYYSPNDGGGGLFYLEESTIAGNSDNGIVFNSIDSGKKWVRNIITDKINVKWFGAKGNGTTPDHQFINNAIKYIRNNKDNILYIPSGNYLYGSTGGTFLGIEDEGLKIQGNGSSSIITGGAPGNALFKIKGNNIEIKKIAFKQTTTRNFGLTIENGAKNIVLDNLYFKGNFFASIHLFECSDLQIINSKFNNVLGYQIEQKA